ncbi:hypothetical protein [Halomarina rubra]|uniref:AlkP-core domain protein n=1 Tax=Halomarina rubra TaxID=2071873 RepID=A0ABD6B3W8_9EURY|nr:hypothetical protein [Halomarina rubra]
MYSLSQVRRALDSPSLITQELNRVAHRRGNRWSYNERGIDLFAEDWDNLLILDACRYDMFCERSTLPGRTESRISRGSATWEFLTANFADRDLTDTVYVTASPMLHRNESELNAKLHAVVNVWQEDGWDDEFRTVMPETLGQYAKEAAEQYPDKRLIVHYLQPHYPFIGPTGRDHFDVDTLAIWDEKRDGKIDIPDEYFVKGTEESLDIVLDHVSELLDDLGGRTVVTSDHGQAFGERGLPIPSKVYGHPIGMYIDELVRVPWHVYDNGPRRTITKEEPVATDEDIDHEVVEDRLKDLGYV